MTHFTLPNREITIFSCNSSNRITKEYYNFLVGEINRGTVIKAVCSITDKRFDYTAYYLISSF